MEPIAETPREFLPRIIDPRPLFDMRHDERHLPERFRVSSRIRWALRYRENKVLGDDNAIAYGPREQLRFFTGQPGMFNFWAEAVDNGYLPTFPTLTYECDNGELMRAQMSCLVSEAEAQSLDVKLDYFNDDGMGRIGFDLSNRDFSRWDIRGADMRNVRADGVVLSGADISGSLLGFSSFRGADMRGAVALDVYAKHADFSGAFLNGADFSGSDLRKAKFIRAVMLSLRAEGARLEDIRMADAIAHGMMVRHARINPDIKRELEAARQRDFTGAEDGLSAALGHAAHHVPALNMN